MKTCQLAFPTVLLLLFACESSVCAQPTVNKTTMGPCEARLRVVSSGGEHCAIVRTSDNKKDAVLVDGVERGQFDVVHDVAFSPAGASLAFVAQKGESWFVVHGDKEFGPFESIDQQSGPQAKRSDGGLLMFSRAGRLAFEASAKGKKIVVIDGTAEGTYDDAFHFVFSDDGKHYAYVARRAGKAWVVRDGIGGQEYDWDEGLGGRGPLLPSISSDGRRLAYRLLKEKATNTKGDWVAVVDGKEEKPFRAMYTDGPVVFSSDGKRYGYRAGPFCMVIDGKECRHELLGEGPLLSSASGQFAYLARNDARVWVIREGKPGAAYVSILNLTFSPDGSRLAYAAHEEEKWFVVDGEREGNRYRRVFSLTFSLDGKHLAYVAEGRNSGTEMVILDGKEGAEYSRIEGPKAIGARPKLCFSPDGKRLAYVGTQGMAMYTRSQLVVDGVPGNKYSEVEVASVAFSPDSKHVAYWARSDKWVLVVDGSELQTFDRPADKRIFWMNTTNLRAFAESGNDCVRVDVTLR